MLLSVMEPILKDLLNDDDNYFVNGVVARISGELISICTCLRVTQLRQATMES
jgi:hypothetical protein